jgi:hypothetical protein
MILRSRFFVVLMAVTFAAQAAPRVLEHVPLKWKPTSDLKLGAVQEPATAIQFEAFKDVRERPELIGENREDEDKGQVKPVTTSDDVGAFVSTHIRDMFKQAGLNTVDSNAGVSVKGEVKQFFVRETSTYQAEVLVHITVVSSNGATVWSGTATGDARRFGRSYVLENYYEVLSDAVVNTVSSILQSAEFQKALAQH